MLGFGRVCHNTKESSSLANLPGSFHMIFPIYYYYPFWWQMALGSAGLKGLLLAFQVLRKQAENYFINFQGCCNRQMVFCISMTHFKC